MAKKSLPVAKPKMKPVPVKIVYDEPMPTTARDNDRERKWKAEDALRIIQKAEEHKKDKDLMSDVKKLAKEQMNSLKKCL